MRLNNNDLFSTYQIALVQMAPEFLNRDANLEKAEKRLREAAANGVNVLAVDCDVTVEDMKIRDFVPVEL